MNSWTRKLPSLDIFKKLRNHAGHPVTDGGEGFAEGSGPHFHLKSPSPSPENPGTPEGEEEDQEDEEEVVGAVYDTTDNLARDVREFYEKRLLSAEEAARKWGRPQRMVSPVKVNPAQQSPTSACSSGYFSLNSTQQSLTIFSGKLDMEGKSWELEPETSHPEPTASATQGPQSTATPLSSPKSQSAGLSVIDDEGLGSLDVSDADDVSSSSRVCDMTHRSASGPTSVNNLQSKLDFLKGELLTLIHQDNDLFKQLLTLNDTIEEMKEARNGGSKRESAIVAPVSSSSSSLSTWVTEEEVEEHSPGMVPEDDEEESEEQEINDLLDEALNLSSDSSSAVVSIYSSDADEDNVESPKSLRSIPNSTGEDGNTHGTRRENLMGHSSSSLNNSFSTYQPRNFGQIPVPCPIASGNHGSPSAEGGNARRMLPQRPLVESKLNASLEFNGQQFLSTADEEIMDGGEVQAVSMRSVLRSQSVLLRSGFQRQRVSFPATGKNRRRDNTPPVRRELPKHLQISSSSFNDSSGSFKNSSSSGGSSRISDGFSTLPSSWSSKKRNMSLNLQPLVRHNLPPPPPPPVDTFARDFERADRVHPQHPPFEALNTRLCGHREDFRQLHPQQIGPVDHSTSFEEEDEEGEEEEDLGKIVVVCKHVKQSSFDSGVGKGSSSSSSSSSSTTSSCSNSSSDSASEANSDL